MEGRRHGTWKMGVKGGGLKEWNAKGEIEKGGRSRAG